MSSQRVLNRAASTTPSLTILAGDEAHLAGRKPTSRSGGFPWAGLAAVLRSTTATVKSHYASRRARLSVAALSVVLTYGGGAAMFWVHAIYRGEQGPPIANPWHWLLDSSLGFLALTPVLVLLVPLAQKLAGERVQRLQAVIVGGMFAVVTTPGPVMHYHVAGAETPLAHLATTVFGRDPHVVAAHLHSIEHSLVSESLLQFAAGLPVYILLTYLTTAILRWFSETTLKSRNISLARNADDRTTVLVRAA